MYHLICRWFELREWAALQSLGVSCGAAAVWYKPDMIIYDLVTLLTVAARVPPAAVIGYLFLAKEKCAPGNLESTSDKELLSQ